MLELPLVFTQNQHPIFFLSTSCYNPSAFRSTQKEFWCNRILLATDCFADMDYLSQEYELARSVDRQICHRNLVSSQGFNSLFFCRCMWQVWCQWQCSMDFFRDPSCSEPSTPLLSCACGLHRPTPRDRLPCLCSVLYLLSCSSLHLVWQGREVSCLTLSGAAEMRTLRAVV